MIIDAEKVLTKKNKTITLRSPSAEDAASLIEALSEIVETAPFLLNSPDSIKSMSVPDEVKWINSFNNDPRGMIMVAEFDAKIVGILDFSTAKNEKILHRGRLAISLAESMRGEGLGELFFKKLLKESKRIVGLTQIELSLFSENHQAYHLYRKVGFQEFARRPNAYKQPDGTFCDEIMMFLSV